MNSLSKTTENLKSPEWCISGTWNVSLVTPAGSLRGSQPGFLTEEDGPGRAAFAGCPPAARRAPVQLLSASLSGLQRHRPWLAEPARADTPDPRDDFGRERGFGRSVSHQRAAIQHQHAAGIATGIADRTLQQGLELLAVLVQRAPAVLVVDPDQQADEVERPSRRHFVDAGVELVGGPTRGGDRLRVGQIDALRAQRGGELMRPAAVDRDRFTDGVGIAQGQIRQAHRSSHRPAGLQRHHLGGIFGTAGEGAVDTGEHVAHHRRLRQQGHAEVVAVRHVEA